MSGGPRGPRGGWEPLRLRVCSRVRSTGGWRGGRFLRRSGRPLFPRVVEKPRGFVRAARVAVQPRSAVRPACAAPQTCRAPRRRRAPTVPECTTSFNGQPEQSASMRSPLLPLILISTLSASGFIQTQRLAATPGRFAESNRPLSGAGMDALRNGMRSSGMPVGQAGGRDMRSSLLKESGRAAAVASMPGGRRG